MTKQRAVLQFCTLFDSFYLTRGLALYNSLQRSGASFHLAIYCFDDSSYDILSELGLKHASLVRLRDFETADLLRVKPTRSRGEYCWTCTSHVIHDALTRFQLDEVTYLDADLFFFSSPAALLDEFRRSGSSVLLTEHRYSTEYDNSERSGKYCVQFMTFRNTEEGLTALSWWKERCLEWCYARVEEGKFGDQKYLDDWTARFRGVHVLQHLGGGVAPWNIQQYGLGEGPRVDGIPVIFYHFHGLKWFSSGKFDLCEYRLSRDAVRLVYRPYLRALSEALEQARSTRTDFAFGLLEREPFHLRKLLESVKRRIGGTYRVVSASQIEGA